MKIKALLGSLLLTGALHAQTLGTTVQEISDTSAAIIAQRQPQADSWGQQTALEDLLLLQRSATVLLEKLQDSDAQNIKVAQRELTAQASRVKSSSLLLPDSPADSAAIEALLGQVQAVDGRLTELRTRFAQRASRVAGSLADEEITTSNEQGFSLYENPHALLIDIRDARQLAASLETGRLPQLGFGLAQPNNLDSLQVRRFIQAGWALQRSAEGSFQDVSELIPQWQKFRFEYDRLGYAGSSSVTRQLERVMQRLDTFFSDFQTQAP